MWFGMSNEEYMATVWSVCFQSGYFCVWFGQKLHSRSDNNAKQQEENQPKLGPASMTRLSSNGHRNFSQFYSQQKHWNHMKPWNIRFNKTRTHRQQRILNFLSFSLFRFSFIPCPTTIPIGPLAIFLSLSPPPPLCYCVGLVGLRTRGE